MKIYVVQYYDEEKKEWTDSPLDMCHGKRLCEKCKRDIKHLDVCDYNFYDTIDYQIAIDKKEMLEEEGDKVRIITK